MTVSNKPHSYALLIEESIRHSDELCRVLNSNTSQVRELFLELDHLITDYQDGEEIQDMTPETYHGKLCNIKNEAEKIDGIVGPLATEIFEKMGGLLKLLSRPILSPHTLQGLDEIGYDIVLIIQSQKALVELQKVVDVHHKYLASRMECYESNKSRFFVKLSEAENKDPLKERQSYYNWRFPWFYHQKKKAAPEATLVLSKERPGWVMKLWNTQCSEIPELTDNPLMRNLPVLLAQKSYNSAKKESSLTSGMKLRPVNLSKLKKNDLDGASIREVSSVKSPTSFRKLYELMDESVDSQHLFYRSETISLKSQDVDLKKGMQNEAVFRLTDERAREECQSRGSSSGNFLTEDNLQLFALEQESEPLILTKSALAYHQINQSLEDDLQRIENTLPSINAFLLELEERQKALITEFSKKQKNIPYEDEENSRLNQFSLYLKQGVENYLNFKYLYNELCISRYNLINAYRVAKTWDLNDSTVETLLGFRFSVTPILQIKKQNIRAELFISESIKKIQIFNEWKSKLKTKLNQAFYNLKWAKNELGLYERGSFMFSTNHYYLDEAVSLIKKEEKEKNPSILVTEDSVLL